MATQETAETKYIDANGTRIAYRRLGAEYGIPLVMLIHFRGNMDFWDPALINALARSRPIILLDNAGIGKSSGEIPTTYHGWALHVIDLIAALGIKEIDLLGFSMGGIAAQNVALAAPGLVRKLILAGTTTSRTPSTVDGDPVVIKALSTAVTTEEFERALALSFYNHSPSGRAAAKASWNRIMLRNRDRAMHLSPELGRRQKEAWRKYTVPHPGNPFERIRELKMPVFVANGDKDLLIPTANSVELAGSLPHAHLHIYPNSGHGFLYEYAELFAAHVKLFLDGVGPELAKL
ncbi:hypothetical protein PVAG01_08789 [Phlyctema vagabunda]|uniref:AB hydrolase-1 domain-containing protein n=1 Tax=Phlyctema vagabunda TaxID=108571 RepID=A0ABR4PAH8_9HELO